MKGMTLLNIGLRISTPVRTRTRAVGRQTGVNRKRFNAHGPGMGGDLGRGAIVFGGGGKPSFLSTTTHIPSDSSLACVCFPASVSTHKPVLYFFARTSAEGKPNMQATTHQSICQLPTELPTALGNLCTEWVHSHSSSRRPVVTGSFWHGQCGGGVRNQEVSSLPPLTLHWSCNGVDDQPHTALMVLARTRTRDGHPARSALPEGSVAPRVHACRANTYTITNCLPGAA